MEVQYTEIEGLVILKPELYGDTRGYFLESYNKLRLSELGIEDQFVQDNQSLSSYGTVRGIHFQTGEYAQSKLVRVVKGKVLDVAVDLRRNSKTFGKHYSIILSDENHFQVYIPRGFGHGFSVLSSEALFLYKCDNYYNPKKESGVAYNDKDLNIDWQVPTDKIIISQKDSLLKPLSLIERQL